MTTITISPVEKKRLLKLAHGRNDGKSAEQSRKKSKAFTDLEIDFLGLKGEYVVSTASGVPFDEESYGSSGDKGVDIVIDGVTYAIKTNHRRNGFLIVERKSDTEVERLVLVDGLCKPTNPATCLCKLTDANMAVAEDWRVAGWIEVDDFWRRCIKKDWGYGDRWYVTQNYLKPLDIAPVAQAEQPVIKGEGMSTEISCPKQPCDMKFPRGSKTTKNDLQHHLYMRHSMDAVESHKLADQVIAEASKK